MMKLSDLNVRVSRWGGAIRSCAFSSALVASFSGRAAVNVYLADVPDYEFHVGCFGTATGNLMGYWDRNGLPNFYTGPSGYGVAPLTSLGHNYGIRSLWASQAGIDGRPGDKPGHVDDYYAGYGSTDDDPHVTLGRAEHEPDCLGDFIGLNQKKWKGLNGECDGNIDNYSFVYWDSSGEQRINYAPGPEAGLPARDIQSGLRAWTKYRGYAADVFTQLSDFNPAVPFGKGFSFEDLKAEIDGGYPVLMFLQDYYTKWRTLGSMERANPLIHGLLAYGYFVGDDGVPFVRYRNSFAGGDTVLGAWSRGTQWSSIAPLRGVICYHPRPQFTSIAQKDGYLTIQWEGPGSRLYDVQTQTHTQLHWYVVETAPVLIEEEFRAISSPSTDRRMTILADQLGTAFYRLRLVTPLELPGLAASREGSDSVSEQ